MFIVRCVFCVGDLRFDVGVWFLNMMLLCDKKSVNFNGWLVVVIDLLLCVVE